MTRVVNGIYDDAELDTGFFIPDRQIAFLCDWLGSYANALEKSWVKNGAVGDPQKQKHTKVRSFINAVNKYYQEEKNNENV